VAAATEPHPSAGAPEPVSEAERAAALAEPAIVVVEVRWEGFARDRVTGGLLDEEPVSGTTWCTGAGVGGEGYLVTTASCLDQASVTSRAFRQVVDRQVAERVIPATAAEQVLAELVAGATIGNDPVSGDPPQQTVTVRRAVTDDEAMPATVVSIADPIDGDAALLKIARGSQPILPLAGSVEVGDEVVTVECPPVAENSGGVTPGPTGGSAEPGPVRPRYRTGIVTATEPRMVVEPTAAGEPAALPAAVVLTNDAALVGLVHLRTSERDTLVEASVIGDLLVRAEVDTEPGQVDRDFRAGLDAYYGGQYTESIERFDAVLAIIPSHVQAHTYRDEAQTRREQQGGGPAPADDWTDRVRRFINGRSGSLVGIGVLAAIAVFLIHRRRPHPDPASPAPTEPPVERSGADLAGPRTHPDGGSAGTDAGEGRET
jgi:hypothetical protein